MQFIVISHQLYEILVGVLIGAVLGLVYDFFRFIRSFFINERIVLLFQNITDILFCTFAGAVYCVFIYHASNGRFRWFTLFAVIFGFVLYNIGPSKLICSLLQKIADIISALFRFVIFPFRILSKFLRKLCYNLICSIKYRKLKKLTGNLKLQLCTYVKLTDNEDLYEIDSN